MANSLYVALRDMTGTRNVRRRLLFGNATKATMEGFETMWETPADSDLTNIGSLFAEDAYLRKEYVEIYELIRKEFGNQGGKGTALVRGSSGVGKSAFLQYVVARIRNEANDVLVVRGRSYDSNKKTFLHLSTSLFGWKIARIITTEEEATEIEKKCSWTIVDGCDWEITGNCAVGAASPSTPWKGFRLAKNLIMICMPPWSLEQLEDCTQLTSSYCNPGTVRENYKLIGGIARWALATTDEVLNQVDSAVKGVNFGVIQQVLAVQHATKNDEKELVHRLILWITTRDENGNWLYKVGRENPIHYTLLTRFVAKEFSRKAAQLSMQKRKTLISELKGEGAASAYRGVLFEADAIDRLVRGETFTLRKCTTDSGTPQEVQFTVANTAERYAMKNLDSLSVNDSIDRIVVPDARNFESVDAFRVSSTPFLHEAKLTPPTVDYETLQFQMTVGESHPTKLKGIKDVMNKVRKDLPNHIVACAVVFVVPDDMQSLYKSPQSVLKNDGNVRQQRDSDFNNDNQYCLVINYTID